jgi:acylphosphatase
VKRERVAAEITVEGRVQGVGFRDYARRRADRLGVVGYVVNLPDGRVRARAEGEREAVDLLIRDLEQGPRLARVTTVAVRWAEPSDAYHDFEVLPAEPNR